MEERAEREEKNMFPHIDHHRTTRYELDYCTCTCSVLQYAHVGD